MATTEVLDPEVSDLFRVVAETNTGRCLESYVRGMEVGSLWQDLWEHRSDLTAKRVPVYKDNVWACGEMANLIGWSFAWTGKFPEGEDWEHAEDAGWVLGTFTRR